MPPSITTVVIAPQEPITYPGISPNGNRRHHLCMEDVYSIRRNNLQQVCTQRCERNQSELGRRLGIEPNLVNRWLRGSKQIGAEAARSVEEKFKLEKGWMDRIHPTDEESIIIERYRKETEDRRKSVRLLLGVEDSAAAVGFTKKGP